MEHSKHIIRAVLLLVLIVMAFVCVRHFAIPQTFGEHGHYRFASVGEYASKAPVHGGPESCAECHDEQAETVAGGKHANVSCEVCHGPLTGHVQGEKRVAKMAVHSSFKLCAWCHQKLVSRPEHFPQVVFQDHVAGKGAEMGPGVCLECHDAHSPSE